jgi:hypothetical protein
LFIQSAVGTVDKREENAVYQSAMVRLAELAAELEKANIKHH